MKDSQNIVLTPDEFLMGDFDERIYVLMGGFAPRYHIVGSMRAIAGKQPQFLTQHGYYRVPRELLRPPRAPEDVI
jgi:hypothetical protein